MDMKTRGFTLLQPLVVIAIIGLLSSIVLAALNTARGKGKDAAILSELGQLVTLAELEYSDSKTYAALQQGWAPATNPCSDFTGNYGTKARDICASIVAKIALASTVNVFYSGITAVSPYSGNYTRYYSFMARLPGKSQETGVTTYACVGSSGGRYVGPMNPGTGDWTGAGCYANP